jgi:SAM-dependent methyltransferase
VSIESSNGYRFRRRNPIEREKLIINRQIASLLRPDRVLDAFAGDGTSARIFAPYAGQVLAIEKDAKNVASLLKSGYRRKITIVQGNNLSLLPLLASDSFDLVDFDPYGSCYPQLKYAARLVSERGVLLITSGEVQRAVRGLAFAHLPTSRHYRGRSAVLWAENVWIPFLLKTLRNGPNGLHLIHFFTSPVLARVILGTSHAKDKLSALRRRKNYLGWFEGAIADTRHTERLKDFVNS